MSHSYEGDVLDLFELRRDGEWEPLEEITEGLAAAREAAIDYFEEHWQPAVAELQILRGDQILEHWRYDAEAGLLRNQIERAGHPQVLALPALMS